MIHLDAQSRLWDLVHLGHQSRLWEHLAHLQTQLRVRTHWCSDTLVGMDTTAYQYDCDVIDDFTLDDFTLVNGEKLK